MKFSDETLMAYADGELDAATRREVEDAMRGDPQIADRIAQHRALRAELGAAFSGVLDEPLPDRLLDSANAQPAGNRPAVADLSAARNAKRSANSRHRWSWPEWTAIAASILLGVFVGRTALQTPDSALVAMREGRLVAAHSLAEALSNQIGAKPEDSSIAIAATFRTTSGEYCRAFTASAPEAVAGIACHEADEWRMHTLVRSGARQSGDAYRMAGATLPPLLLQTVESMMAGDALDAEQEKTARERGWRAAP
ncbi:MAG: anti-sigma factor family protein [Steroidobacter sp.]